MRSVRKEFPDHRIRNIGAGHRAQADWRRHPHARPILAALPSPDYIPAR